MLPGASSSRTSTSRSSVTTSRTSVVAHARAQQLREEHVGRRQREGLAPQPPPQPDGVMQAEGVEVHVDAVVGVERPSGTGVRAGPVHLQERAAARQADVAVLLVAQAGERAQEPLGRGARRDQVEVAMLAPAGVPGGAQREDGEAADEPDVDAVGARRSTRSSASSSISCRPRGGAAEGEPSMPTWYRAGRDAG